MPEPSTSRVPEPSGGEPPSEAVHLVLVTGPDRQSLLRLGRQLVRERLAACANVWDGLDSVFRWEGEVQEEREALALLKTTTGRLDALRRRVAELHPYEEPEFLAFTVDRGSPSYLSWVVDSVGEAVSDGR